MTFITYLIEHAFAGIWTMVWHFGIGIGIIILCGVGALYLPTTKLKLLCVGIALVTAAILVGEGVGINMAAARCTAQEKAVTSFVNKTVKGTTTPSSKGARDPFDSKDN